MTTVAAVLVTSNSQRWIAETVESVLSQSRQPDVFVIVDDRSVDGTRDVIHRMLGAHVRLVESTATSNDRVTRIAHNFRQALDEARDLDIAILGDHDDVWHPNRIGHQAGLLETWREDAMLASDGRLMDDAGRVTEGTLRSAFPVPIDWSTATPRERMRAVIRYSVATGGASAVRPVSFADVPMPQGWLHDRWWSLVAAAREELRLDDECVIDYRVSSHQEVGLGRGQQDKSGRQRLRAGLGNAASTLRRVQDVHWLESIATPETHPELSYTRLARNLL